MEREAGLTGLVPEDGGEFDPDAVSPEELEGETDEDAGADDGDPRLDEDIEATEG